MFHFPDGNANILTNAALDKYARIPEYKVCAVKVEKLGNAMFFKNRCNITAVLIAGLLGISMVTGLLPVAGMTARK